MHDKTDRCVHISRTAVPMIELVQGRAHKKVSVEFAKKNFMFQAIKYLYQYWCFVSLYVT